MGELLKFKEYHGGEGLEVVGSFKNLEKGSKCYEPFTGHKLKDRNKRLMYTFSM